MVSDTGRGPRVPVWTRYLDPVVEGAHHLPQRGAVIVAASHISHLDRVWLARALPRQLTFPGARPGAGDLPGVALAAIRGRTAADPADRRRESALARLRAGQVVAIFPEGTPSPDGRLYRGQTEVAALALETGAPVVPVAIIGRDGAAPLIRVGERIGLSEWSFGADQPALLRAATDTVMYALMDLSGCDYVDLDAGLVRLQLERVARHEAAATRAAKAAHKARRRAEASTRSARYAAEAAELARAEARAVAAAQEQALLAARADASGAGAPVAGEGVGADLVG